MGLTAEEKRAGSRDRQQKFRESKREGYRRLDILLPITDKELFISNAKAAGETHSKHLQSLLYGNRVAVIDDQVGELRHEIERVDGLRQQAVRANEPLIVERDKAVQELSHLRPEASRQSETIAEQKQELKQLRAKIRRLNDPVLGDGRYDGSIPLAVALKMNSRVSDKEAEELTRQAKKVFNIAKGEKLSPDQNMKLYNWIIDKV